MRTWIFVALTIAIFGGFAGNAAAEYIFGVQSKSTLGLSIYNPDTAAEIGYNLGVLGGELDLAQQNVTLCTVDVTDPTATVALYSATENYLNNFFGLTTPTAPGAHISGLAPFTNGVGGIFQLYNGDFEDGGGGGTSPTSQISTTELRSAYMKFKDFGNYAGIVVGGRPELQPSLAPLADGAADYVDIYLYQYGVNPTTYAAELNKGFDTSTDYAAIIRINADGSVILNPIIDKDPVADAGVDQSVEEGDTVTLDGSGSRDPEGGALTYVWARKDSEPVSVSLSHPTTASPTFAAPQVGAGGVTLEFGLTVTDSAGNTSDEDTVTITVNNINQAPTAEAGDDRTVDESGGTITLDGSGSSDPDEGDSLSYAWLQEGGTGVVLSDDTAMAPTFDAPAVDADETLVFRLTVTDESGETAEDTVSVTVRFVNQAPVAVATPASQDANVGDTVTLSGAGSSDPDAGDSIASYSWAQTGGSPAVTLNPSAASPEVTFPAPSTNATLVFALTVTDTHGGRHSATASVNVSTGANQPPVPHAGENQTVFERTIVILDASGTTDPDGVEDIVSYHWEQTGGTIVTLSDVNAIQPTFTAPAAGEDLRLEFKLTVTDRIGFTPTATVFISVWPNHPPSAPSVNTPTHEGEADSRTPSLSINNASDADGHDLDYTFELHGTSDLTDPIESAVVDGSGDSTTGWQTPELMENTTYYWRVQASDGIDTSEWMDLATFFVNAIEEAPTLPSVSTPPDGATVGSATPVLEVTNATDPDGDDLSYEFRLYTHADAPVDDPFLASPDIMEETDGSTGWTVGTALIEGQVYWWRVQATDNTGRVSGWTIPVQFMVNAQNSAPTTPELLSAADGSDVQTLIPELIAANAVDDDGDALSYLFEIDSVSTFNGEGLVQSSAIAEQAGGATAWQPGTLIENTRYYWRVRAFDGQIYSAWATGRFRINRANDPPSVPQDPTPPDGKSVTTLRPALRVVPASDPDDDAADITYDFQLFVAYDQNASLDETNDSQSNSWTPDADLLNHEHYTWRARAYDGEDYSDWSAFYDFTIDANFYPPTVPIINQPYGGGTVNSLTPVLSVINATDDDGDPLTIEFELYRDAGLNDFVASRDIPQGNPITSWNLATALSDGSTYYWRARATDGVQESSWTATASFSVDLAGGDPVVTFDVLSSVAVPAAAPWDTEIAVRDGGALDGVAIRVPPGALKDNATLFIGKASGAPALPPDIRSVGAVMEFGPTGKIFNTGVEVTIPYSQSVLASAGMDSPEGLQLYTYNTTDGRWEAVPDVKVDQSRQVLVCSLSHFSLYAVGGASSPPAEDSGGGGGGGGGCFIGNMNATGRLVKPAMVPGVFAGAAVAAMLFIKMYNSCMLTRNKE